MVIARKIYRGLMESAGFLVPPIDTEFYPEKDYHTVHHAELVKTVGSCTRSSENQDS
jgi:hypothetical protein